MNMKTITVNGNEYKLTFSFEAAEYKDIVQKEIDSCENEVPPIAFSPNSSAVLS